MAPFGKNVAVTVPPPPVVTKIADCVHNEICSDSDKSRKTICLTLISNDLLLLWLSNAFWTASVCFSNRVVRSIAPLLNVLKIMVQVLSFACNPISGMLAFRRANVLNRRNSSARPTLCGF